MIIRDTLIAQISTVLVEMIGEIEGEDFVAWRIDLSRRHAVDRLHIIYDLRRYTGGVDHEHLAQVASAIREPLTDRSTVIVSADRGMELWAQAILLAYSHAIPGRRFAVKKSMAAAFRELSP